MPSIELDINAITTNNQDQVQLFDPSKLKPYPLLIESDTIVLDGSNAKYGFAYIPYLGATPLLAEMFFPPYCDWGDIDLLTLDGTNSRIGMNLETGVSPIELSQEELLYCARVGLHRYHRMSYEIPNLIEEARLLAA